MVSFEINRIPGGRRQQAADGSMDVILLTAGAEDMDAGWSGRNDTPEAIQELCPFLVRGWAFIETINDDMYCRESSNRSRQHRFERIRAGPLAPFFVSLEVFEELGRVRALRAQLLYQRREHLSQILLPRVGETEVEVRKGCLRIIGVLISQVTNDGGAEN